MQHSIPIDLFNVYDRVILAIQRGTDGSKELANKILSWLFYAERPLQMKELREAIIVEEGDVELDEDDFIPEDEIIDICGSLVSYDAGSGVVSFSHEMVQKFLKARYREHLLQFALRIYRLMYSKKECATTSRLLLSASRNIALVSMLLVSGEATLKNRKSHLTSSYI